MFTIIYYVLGRPVLKWSDKGFGHLVFSKSLIGKQVRENNRRRGCLPELL